MGVQTALIEQAYMPTTFATTIPTAYMERPTYAAPTVVEPIVYSAPALVEERISLAVPRSTGKDLKTGGKVVSERPISREELSANGNLAEAPPETRQGGYSTGFSAARAAPVAYEQSAFIGSSRRSLSTVPQAIGQVQSSYAIPRPRSGSLSTSVG